jgi:UDP-N-acetylglucosamine 2-epimerase (non-hydrolysing)
VYFVGNIMMDTLFAELPYAETSRVLPTLGVEPQSYVYITLHRPSNVDVAPTLRRLMEVFSELAKDVPFVFAVHPRTRRRLAEAGITLGPVDRFRVIEPLGYRDNLRMIQCAMATVTDSGGIQEEASVLGIPCLTVRNCTERPVTVELGSSELVGNEPERIREAWGRLRAGQWKRVSPIPLWDGHTSERIVRHLREAWG